MHYEVFQPAVTSLLSLQGFALNNRSFMHFYGGFTFKNKNIKISAS